MKRRRKKIFLFSFLGILIATILFIGIFVLFNLEDEQSSLTILEKQWIEKNKQNLIDINVVNGISVISDDGNGIVFDFLLSFEEITGLTFNKIPYNYGTTPPNNLTFKLVNYKEKLSDKDLILWEDNYIVLGKKNIKLENILDLKGENIGILATDSDVIKYRLSNVNTNFNLYDDISSLTSAFKSSTVSYIIIPNYIYLSSILELENTYVNYQLSDISNKIVLTFGDNEKLNVIISKYFTKWKDNLLSESLSKSLLEFYYDENKTSDLDKTNLTAKVYKYGYIESLPYNTVSNKKLYGIAGEYINTLHQAANMEFEYIKYPNKAKLEQAIKEGKVDIAFVNFDMNTSLYLKTSYLINNEMVVLGKNYLSTNSKYGLASKDVFVYENTNLFNYIKENYNSTAKLIMDFKEVQDQDVLVVDKNQYLFYEDNKYDNYKLITIDSYNNGYNFIVKNNQNLVYEFLNFMLNYGNYSYYHNHALNNLNFNIKDKTTFETFYLIILAIVFIPMIFVFVFKTITKKHYRNRNLKKEDRLKYTDMLTSLKNRNYLNENISIWEEMEVYPRTIMIVDLNNLKYVNDNHGYKEGNNLITKAASILINTQLQKSEIIRSDGNEFLIYLLGYSEKQIQTYTMKLQKELDKLPYGFGAAIGYSTISNQTKTIEDAINEATISMRESKNKQI